MVVVLFYFSTGTNGTSEFGFKKKGPKLDFELKVYSLYNASCLCNMSVW